MRNQIQATAPNHPVSIATSSILLWITPFLNTVSNEDFVQTFDEYAEVNEPVPAQKVSKYKGYGDRPGLRLSRISADIFVTDAETARSASLMGSTVCTTPDTMNTTKASWQGAQPSADESHHDKSHHHTDHCARPLVNIMPTPPSRRAISNGALSQPRTCPKWRSDQQSVGSR